MPNATSKNDVRIAVTLNETGNIVLSLRSIHQRREYNAYLLAITQCIGADDA